jgi:hypothetical protein
LEELSASIFSVEETLRMETPDSSKMVAISQTTVLHITKDSIHVFIDG